MGSIFIYSLDNIILDGFVDAFSQKLDNNLFIFKKTQDKYDIEDKVSGRFKIINSFEDIKYNLSGENLFIFNTDFLNDIFSLNEGYIDTICCNLDKMFEFFQYIVRLAVDSGEIIKIIFITVNSTLLNTFDFPVSAIYDEAIHCFVKSVSKEIKSVLVNVVCIEPIFEMLSTDYLKRYRRQMKVYASQKSPVRIHELIKFIDYLLSNDSRLLTGKIIYIGEGT